jgi:hypothetical protein
MKLFEYLHYNNISLKVFGNRIGVSSPTMTAYKKGIKIPPKSTMEKIIKETKGQVMPNDFYLKQESKKDRLNDEDRLNDISPIF